MSRIILFFLLCSHFLNAEEPSTKSAFKIYILNSQKAPNNFNFSINNWDNRKFSLKLLDLKSNILLDEEGEVTIDNKLLTLTVPQNHFTNGFKLVITIIENESIAEEIIYSLTIEKDALPQKYVITISGNKAVINLKNVNLNQKYNKSVYALNIRSKKSALIKVSRYLVFQEGDLAAEIDYLNEGVYDVYILGMHDDEKYYGELELKNGKGHLSEK
jgi:hypothetical protein